MVANHMLAVLVGSSERIRTVHAMGLFCKGDLTRDFEKSLKKPQAKSWSKCSHGTFVRCDALPHIPSKNLFPEWEHRRSLKVVSPALNLLSSTGALQKMVTQEGKSLSELEKEAEHTRADLIHTVDELHSRVSPQAIKEEMKAYARDTGNELIHSLERKARENPLQAVAVAAGLAYPAWRFLINIPAPILLVGAGLALSQFGGSSRASTAGGANARSSMSGEDGEENLTHTLKRSAQDASSHLADAVKGLKGKVSDAAEEAKSGVS